MTSSLPSPPFPDPSLKAHSPLNAQNVLLLALAGASPGLGSAHVLPGHSPISPAPVQVEHLCWAPRPTGRR